MLIKNHNIAEFEKTIKFFIQENKILYKKQKPEIVILCIGSSKITGDSLGPLVGSILEDISIKNVYGTISSPVHALNLDDTIDRIYVNHKKPVIIAIDASLGSLDGVGNINIWKGSLKPGSGVHKKLSSIGDISITGIVNSYGLDGYIKLKSTDPNTVIDIAYTICKGLQNVLKNTNH